MATKAVVVLDGGTGTSLADRGFKDIDAVVDLHSSFYESGSDVVVAATYQASVEGYVRRFGITETEAEDLVAEGVRLANQARAQAEQKLGRKCWVAASVGPYGAILGDRSEYHGKYAEKMSSQELVTWHTQRTAAILKGGPDLLAIETIPVVKEAEAILESLKNFQGVRAWFSFQCKDGAHTGHGELFSDAVRTVLQSDDVIAVGMNCTHPDDVTPLLQSISSLDIRVPLLVKPNRAGLYVNPTCDTTLKEMTSQWMEHGARMIGGCCHYGPKDIAELRHFLETKSDVELPGLKRILSR
ncbi:hypothetical protein BaRGS_00028191 [Batillaria attramentaria]|uniref:Hcy-binding domain-containing protein n=1 Tax=Batillaria attramentaria TaxID=370345 RepID=A0ABD0K0T6_9CAEN